MRLYLSHLLLQYFKESIFSDAGAYAQGLHERIEDGFMHVAFMENPIVTIHGEVEAEHDGILGEVIAHYGKNKWYVRVLGQNDQKIVCGCNMHILSR